MTEMDPLHRLLDDAVQVMSAAKTGRTQRVRVGMRPLQRGVDWRDVLANEAKAVIGEQDAKNTRTRARRGRACRTVRKTI